MVEEIDDLFVAWVLLGKSVFDFEMFANDWHPIIDL